MKLTITGDTPSLKNSKQIYRTSSGRPFITSSKRAKDWNMEKRVEIHSMHLPPMAVDEENPVSVSVIFYNSTRRKADIDNKLTAILDLIKDTGLISDDNCFVVRKIHAEFGGVDRENPRAEVSIEHL